MNLFAQNGHVYRAFIQTSGFERRFATPERVQRKITSAGDGSDPAWRLVPTMNVGDLGDGKYVAEARYEGPDGEVELPYEITEVIDLGPSS